jgi:AcrR family transcriptional regulator
MPAGAQGGRRARGSLTVDVIIAAAEGFVADRGAAQFTVTALAREMEVPVTSIYWHFRTREDLLGALADRAIVELYQSLRPMTGDRPWDDQLVEHFSTLRRPLRKLSAIASASSQDGQLYGRLEINETVRESVDSVMRMLSDAGIAPENTFRIYQACTVYVRGFVTVERGRPGERDQSVDPDPVRSRSDGWLHFSGEVPPTIQSLTGEWNWDEQFDIGLRALIAGLKQELGAESP